MAPDTTPLKGRKKFFADLKDASQKSYTVQGLKVTAVTKGEDDGSMTCEIADDDGDYLTTLNILVPEPSEYPKHHTFMCFVQHDDPPEYIQDAAKLLSLLAKHSTGGHQAGSDDDDEEMFYGDHDDEYGININIVPSTFDMTCLQRDFTEIVADGYKPGCIRLGVDGFCLSVSIPVVSLAHDIPPQALMAWDARLLSKTQHLTLLISGLRSSWPILKNDGNLLNSAKLSFRVGLTRSYKPPKELVVELVRQFTLQAAKDEPEEIPEPVNYYDADEMYEDVQDETEDPATPEETMEPVVEEESPATFAFSLSSSMESLMQDRFLPVVQMRKQYNLGWAAAELLIGESQRLQQKPEDLFVEMIDELREADAEEHVLRNSYKLPVDPLVDRQRDDALNLPLLAFSYFLRRLTLCPRFCLICYKRLNLDFVALKPYVCTANLCAYQYYNLSRGPSLEYEIRTRPQAVELLVSLTYVAAETTSVEGALPTGLGLQVPDPTQANQLIEFDTLNDINKSKAVASVLKTLPSINDMKTHLEKKAKPGRPRPKLKDMDPKITPAAWLMLRWYRLVLSCIASCTAHLEELTLEEDQIRNIPKRWRQFRFIVGSPDAEAKMDEAKRQAAAEDSNARKYPSLFAFHGSSAKNWHSIIRHGLWFKDTVHGRAYGHGVYFAKEYSVSMMYCKGAGIVWPNQRMIVDRCAAIAEIVNRPSDRYLLIDSSTFYNYQIVLEDVTDTDVANIAAVQLDPVHPLTVAKHKVLIPEPSYKLNKLLDARILEYTEENYDTEDQNVFDGRDTRDPILYRAAQDDLEVPPVPAPRRGPRYGLEEWMHDPAWVTKCMPHVLPAPADAMRTATMALQRELKNMLREQEEAENLAELGWYMPPEFVGDNLFQWIVELHSFEKELPVAKDMKARGVNSLVFEIRFPAGFPHSPPFFRILKPRFLPFIQGGGGHVTGGGSMCMDLLTADGWLPSYSIPAILLQIKLAISNLDPRPARLAANWDHPYAMQEAIAGFRRAAATHGWTVPQGLERLA
ncbi:hypothetical protein EUX98_g6282 [Antrodiella citrinella]|uniref:UBC core domain-containing protein n=1 Tax=Antrodiella citrinella TaxID=2447956 RepID=A0A4S4MQ86_9APHY|nr:hypothetical protein EUX98_g6282 [Antrodiella citrinella]